MQPFKIYSIFLNPVPFGSGFLYFTGQIMQLAKECLKLVKKNVNVML